MMNPILLIPFLLLALPASAQTLHEMRNGTLYNPADASEIYTPNVPTGPDYEGLYEGIPVVYSGPTPGSTGPPPKRPVIAPPPIRIITNPTTLPKR